MSFPEEATLNDGVDGFEHVGGVELEWSRYEEAFACGVKCLREVYYFAI